MILIVIPAKEKSTRLPGKNMLALNGKPMLDYAVDTARRSKRAHEIVITTDSDEIAQHAETLNVRVIRRGVELGGEVPLIDVYRHAAEVVGLNDIEYLIGLQVDHPDRNIEVDDALAFFVEQEADYLTSSESDGTVNGSFKIYTNKMLLTNDPQKHVVLVDDCTNIHHQEDLELAKRILDGRRPIE